MVVLPPPSYDHENDDGVRQLRVPVYIHGDRYQMSCGHNLMHYFNNVDEMPPTMAFHLMAVASNGIEPLAKENSAHGDTFIPAFLDIVVDHRVHVNPWRVVGWKVTTSIYYLIVPEPEVQSIINSYMRKRP
jgi:hypothetical protein